MKNKIYIISNDKIFKDENGFLYGPNNDLDNIVTSLKVKFEVNLIVRKTKKKNNFKLSKVKIFDKKKFEKDMKILMISLSPYNFLKLFYLVYIKNINISGHIYFRSDGFLEYKYRYGWLGYYIYFLMFSFVKKRLNFISCSNNFTHINNQSLVFPSEIDNEWLIERNEPSLDTIRFLYVGRYTYDKGGFFLKDLFQLNTKNNFHFTIVGFEKKVFDKKENSSFTFHGLISDKKELIKIYDNCNIFLLPSYIEGFPKVINECLARQRPVIIFDEIDYVINKREGIFKCKRDIDELFRLSNYIIDNYEKIQTKMMSNKSYSKIDFQKRLLEKI
ncbi:glycosyltransferase family 4 protein [Pelagibacterales bacterium SAG-MED12]|nr:glycosyltransferase family 4 protein [Pelagibacterales bacterium SAG-MED12]